MLKPADLPAPGDISSSTVGQSPLKKGKLNWRWGLMALICAASLSLRFAHLWKSSRFHVMVEVERAAASLAEHGEIARVYGSQTGLSAHVSPLYPLFLGGIYKLFGAASVTSRLIQGCCAILATTASFAMLPWVSGKLGLHQASGWIAAGVLAILPVNLWYETPGDFEQPYVSLLLLGLLGVFCRLKDEGWRNIRTSGFCGILTGLAALLYPALLPFVGLAVLGELVASRRDPIPVVKGILSMSLVAAIIVAPWAARNWYALGGIVPFRSNFGLELAIGNNPQADGKTYATNSHQKNAELPHLHPFSNPEERARLTDMGELAYMKDKQRQAMQWMIDHPLDFIRLTCRRLRLYWLPSDEMWPSDDPMLRFKQWTFHSVTLAGFATLIWMIAVRHRSSVLVSAAMIGPSMVYLITHVDLRYRYATFALSTLLAVEFVLLLAQKISDASNRQSRLGISTGSRPIEV